MTFTGTTYAGSVITNTGKVKTQVVDKKPILNVRYDKRNIYTGDQGTYAAGTVEQLGNLSIENAGYADSGRIRMLYEFDINTSEGTRNSMNVSYIRLPVPKGKTAAVTCTLVDENNSNSLELTLTTSQCTANNEGVPLSASQVAKAGGKTGEWYFKSISYEIESIPQLTQLYQDNAIRTITYAGNYYGRLNQDATSQLSAISIETDGTQRLLFAQTLVSQKPAAGTKDTNTKPLHIASVAINGEADKNQSVTAGSDATLDISLGMHTYPYGTSQWAQNPILYFLAPAGVTLNSSGVSARWSDGSSEEITTKLDSWTLEDGRTAYRVQFNGTAAFGGPSLSADGAMTSAAKTRYPIVTLRVSTAAGMKYADMFFRNSFYVSEPGAAMANTPPLYTQDVYGLAGTNTTANIGCYNSGKDTKLTVTPNVSTVKFTAQARMENETDASYRSGAQATSRLYISSNSSTLHYRVKLENDSGGIVPRGNLYYYIPVPKQGAALPSGMGNEPPAFGFSLTGAVSVSGSNPTIYELRYSTNATADNYDNGAPSFDSSDGKAVWLTAEEIYQNKLWADVTMVKLIVKESVSAIPRDTVDYFTLKLQCTETDEGISQKAGSSLIWRSAGRQIAQDGQKYTATPSEDTSAMIRFEDARDITMTASAQDQDQGAITVSSDSADILSPIAFSMPVDISVQSVTMNNVILDPSASFGHYDAASKVNKPCDATGEAANSHFGLTAALNGGTAVELSSGAGESLGTIASGAVPEITLKLFNHKAMSDSTTPRSVTVVFGDGAGIQLTVHITIARRLTTVTDPQSHIQSGKFYNPLPGSASSVKVTGNSALTAQYSYQLIPANAISQSLVLTDTSGKEAYFPDGAMITMIDSASYGDTAGGSYAPKYYYYKVLGAATSEIPLGAFINMADGSTPFFDPAEGDGEQHSELLSFIVDFGAGGNSLVTGNYYLHLRVKGLAGSSDTDRYLRIEAAAARTFSLAASASGTMSNGSLTVAGTAGADAAEVKTGMDSRCGGVAARFTRQPGGLPRGGCNHHGRKAICAIQRGCHDSAPWQLGRL